MCSYNYNLLLRTAYLSLTFFLAIQTVQAQTKIGGTAGPGNASAVLELESTAQGFLHPRMTTLQRDNINNPATGLTIYNTTTNCIQVYKGAANGGWHDFCNTAGAFSFTNCSTPVITGAITSGAPTTATIQLNYINNTGQTHGAFTSVPVSDITLTAPGGAVTPITAGTGSITLTASGTPSAPGNINIPVVLAGAACNIPLTVDAPVGCSDPGPTHGSTGCVTFTYRGAQVTYTTVRAKDNKIWLQQNLGAAQVATSTTDVNAYGDLFQWGRWDDGHQSRTSTAAAAPTPNNPSGISAGSALFYINWYSAGANTNTWAGTTPTATNGIDPCAALGAGWHIPSAPEWTTVASSEATTTLAAAYASNLKIINANSRNGSAAGAPISPTNEAYYWSSKTDNSAGYGAPVAFANSGTSITWAIRNAGLPVRCVK